MMSPGAVQNMSQLVLELQGLTQSTEGRPVFLVVALCSYLLTLLLNLTLVLTVCLDQQLHQPIYIFACNLCLNGLLGASCFYPKLLHDLLADVHLVTYDGCLTQLFTIYTYVFSQFSSLTLMAYDRYLAICRPLQYGTVMSPQKAGWLLLFVWIFSSLESLGGTLLTRRLTLCGRHLSKLFCTNWEVVKLSCSASDTTPNNIYGFVLTISHLSQTALILVSYTHLVRASLRLRSQRRKFVQTCVPHLVTLLVFTITLVFDIMYSRYGSDTQQVLKNILAAEFLVVPPVINPVIYGINLHQLRSKIFHRFSHRSHVSKINCL